MRQMDTCAGDLLHYWALFSDDGLRRTVDKDLASWIGSANTTGNVAGLPKMNSKAALKAVVTSVLYRITFHGIGRLRRAELAARKPAPALAMMKAIKAALDPQGLLNPGVLLPD